MRKACYLDRSGRSDVAGSSAEGRRWRRWQDATVRCADCVGVERRFDGDAVHRLNDVLFDVRIEDQGHSTRLLREGAMMGVVTTERDAVGVVGCRRRGHGLSHMRVARFDLRKSLRGGIFGHGAAVCGAAGAGRYAALPLGSIPGGSVTYGRYPHECE